MSEVFGNRQKQSLVVFLLLLAGITYRSCITQSSTPEEIVRGAVEELILAAEKGDTDPFKDWLSNEVVDDAGRNREEILKSLFGIFFTYKNIKLTQVQLDVNQGTNPDVVTAQLSLLMGSDTPLPSDKGDFVLTFRLNEERWQIREIEWADGAKYAP